MSQRRPVPPSAVAIVESWNKDLKEVAHCFACGYTGTGKTSWRHATLIKAHVVPFSLGGSNDPSNFVLLCCVCHYINPETPSRADYLRWLDTAPKSKAYLDWIALGKIRNPGERTKEALDKRKAQGVRLGRPVVMDPSTRDLILRLHGEGMSLRRIAQHLIDLGVETAHGGATWHASTVSRAIKTVVVS